MPLILKGSLPEQVEETEGRGDGRGGSRQKLK